MAMAEFALPGWRPFNLRLLLLRRPEFIPAVLVAVSWVALVALTTGRGSSGHAHSSMAGMPDMPGMPGMAMPRTSSPTSLRLTVITALPLWIVMAIAMMGPAALGGTRHTGLNSLRWRRGRAMAEYGAAYLVVWTAYGAVALGLAQMLPDDHGWIALGVVLGGAAIWQLNAPKRRWLRDCHRSSTLPMRGWRADLGAARFGLRNGLACLGSCWCLMLIMIAAPGDMVLWMVPLTAITTTERLVDRPRRVTRTTGAILAIAAATSLALGIRSPT